MHWEKVLEYVRNEIFMTKTRENVFLIFLLLLFFVAFFLISKTYTASQIPEFEAGMISVPENMAFGTTIDAASCNPDGGKSCDIDSDSAKKEIDAAADMGANFARFNLAGETLDSKEELQKLDEAVSYARGHKLKINLALWGRKKWMRSYGGNGIAWEEFKKKYTEDAGSYVRRYRPDYFVILPDCPYVPGSQTDSEKTVEQWLEFAKQAALSAKQNFYDSKIILEGFMSAEDDVRKREAEFLNAVIRNSDPIISIISIKEENVSDLEDGVKNLFRMKEKYHWQGAAWLGSVDFSSGNFLSGKQDDGNSGQEQKKFFLYAFYLADTNGFSGVSVGSLHDRAGNNNGILKGDYSSKPAYDAMKQVMAGDK